MTTAEQAQVREIIEKISALEIEKDDSGFRRVTQEQGEYIAHLFGGKYAFFEQLDSQSMRFSWVVDVNEWHWKLRQARNNTTNPSLFDILNQDYKKNKND